MGIVWFGQLISVLGSALTSFALGLRVFQETGSVTSFALLSLCNVLPVVLLALLAYFAVANFIGGMIGVLAQPMILSFASADVLGVVFTVAGAGFLLGSMVMSAWGGPRRRVDGILGFGLVFGLGLCTLGLQPVAVWVGLGAFVAHFAIPLINGCNQAIWQSRVPPELQGRVFALRQTVARLAQPLAILAAGPLADRVFGPWLAPGAFWANSLGGIIGVGPGRGIGPTLHRYRSARAGDHARRIPFAGPSPGRSAPAVPSDRPGTPCNWRHNTVRQVALRVCERVCQVS